MRDRAHNFVWNSLKIREHTHNFHMECIQKICGACVRLPRGTCQALSDFHVECVHQTMDDGHQWTTARLSKFFISNMHVFIPKCVESHTACLMSVVKTYQEHVEPYKTHLKSLVKTYQKCVESYTLSFFISDKSFIKPTWQQPPQAHNILSC